MSAQKALTLSIEQAALCDGYKRAIEQLFNTLYINAAPADATSSGAPNLPEAITRFKNGLGLIRECYTAAVAALDEQEK